MTLQKVLRSHHGYIVPRADGRIIAGSTLENVGFVKETTQEGRRQIFDAAVALAPALAGAEIVERDADDLPSAWIARMTARPSMVNTTWDRLLETPAAA